jgi:hypothetical protein
MNSPHTRSLFFALYMTTMYLQQFGIYKHMCVSVCKFWICFWNAKKVFFRDRQLETEMAEK